MCFNYSSEREPLQSLMTGHTDRTHVLSEHQNHRPDETEHERLYSLNAALLRPLGYRIYIY